MALSGSDVLALIERTQTDTRTEVATVNTRLARFTAELEGGFLIEEGRGAPCGPGAGCLLSQVLSPDRSGLIRVVGVDLVKQTIPYRQFVPSEHPGVK